MKKTFQNIISINLKKYYQKISYKTLILWGEKDTSTPLKDAYLLKKIISNSILKTYENTNHFPYLEKEKEVLQDMDHFIKKEDI